MPRGNDAEAAAHELADKFGEGSGNASELIDAVQAEISPEMATIQIWPVDEEATAALDLDELEGPDGERVEDAAVHVLNNESATIVVFLDDTGRHRKAIYERKEAKKPGKRRSSRTKTQKAKPKAKDESDQGEAKVEAPAEESPQDGPQTPEG